jgi:tetratricopeptide (TPR) repeat protein
MTLEYHNLSSGYIGEIYTDATLNSQYYGTFFTEMHNAPEQLTNIMVFPQRIPKIGFFEELYTLETPYYRNHFDKKVAVIRKNHETAALDLNNANSENLARCYINWSNILLRYGCFEDVINHSPKNYSGPSALEINLIEEMAKTEFLLSQDKPINTDTQLVLADKYIHDNKTTDREKIILLNKIVVNYYRHQKESSNHAKIFDLCHILLDLTQRFETNTFINMLYCSVSYRGLAMAIDFGNEKQKAFLDIAEHIARNLPWKTNVEKIVSGENLFTCLQTMSKWSLFNKEIEKAENYLCELITIDSHDSTGYSELGFFYLQTENYDKASQHFKSAIKLGPPGSGMNAYFYAKCLENLGREQESIEYLYESTKLDKDAISPWLDLMNYYIHQKQQDKASQIANHIYQSPTLFEQLEDDEAITIKNLI